MSSLESDLRIELIQDENSPYVEQVRKLADANTKTLSFLPFVVYQQRANSPGILVALIKEELAGYIIWSINKRKRLTRLWQLCIKPQYREKQVAKKLNEKLVELARQSSREIRLECKDNYGIDEMWRKLGYSVNFEKPAKNKRKSETLKVWIMPFVSNQQSILSINTSELTNFKCSIDAQTLNDFIEPNKQQESLEWLSSYLGVCVTDEIFNEIDQFYPELKNKLWSFVQTKIFKQESDPLKFQKKYHFIKTTLGENNHKLEETDIRHLARCLAGDIPYFITQKRNVLNLANFIFKNIDVKIISLQEAIDLRDNNTDLVEYQPLRLENHNVELEILDKSKLDEICSIISEVYQNSDPDKLLQKLKQYNIDNKKFVSYILSYENEPQILFVYDTSQKEQIEVPILRVIKQTSLTNTLLNFVVNKLLEIAISEHDSCLKITDPFLRETEQIILERQYFIKNKQGFEWVKPCYRDTLNSQEVIKYLSNLGKNHFEYLSTSKFLNSWLDSEEVLNDPLYCMDLERLLYPLKIENAQIPSFIIPIKPEYAKELFDKNLAEQNLFGSQRTDLFLGLDRVYYKSIKANAGLKKAPARIFWYVSQDKDSGYSDLSCIRACSQVDDVVFDTPEQLHKKFQHLGYYHLEQIQSCSSKSNQVMAIKFSHTEQFDNPISLQKLEQCLEKRITMQSMRKISQAEFMKLYRLGFNLKLK